MRLPNTIGEKPSNPADAYLPFPVAMNRGIPVIDEEKVHDPINAFRMFQNGYMADQGGLINLSRGHEGFDPDNVCGLDLLRSYVDQDGERVLASAPKSAVDKRDDRVLQSGLLTLTYPSGLIKVIGLSLASEANPWLRKGREKKVATYMLGLEAIVLEIADVVGDQVKTRRRNRLY